MKSKIWIVSYLSGLLLVFRATGRLYGQAAATGAILGTVTDSSGGVVPDAEVTVTDSTTGQSRTARTNSGGLFDIEALTAAGTSYKVTIKKEGFKLFNVESL